MIYKTTYKSPIGILTIASKNEKLIGLWIEGQKYFASDIKETMIENDNLEIFCETKNWLKRYFKGEKPTPEELTLSPEGSEFRQTVWQVLCKIPYGQTITYGEIANIIAKQKGLTKMSPQAVGNAVGHNPISIIIPCHRVIGSNGSLTGYAGGINTKIKLLELENIDKTKILV